MRALLSKITVLVLVLISPALFSQTPQDVYVCTPCGHDCDRLVFDKPGKCPHCNMPLLKQHEDTKEKKARTAVILLFNGVQIIDFTGPFEVLGEAGYEVKTVSVDPSVTTNMGMKVSADFKLDNCPEAGIFVIPGGDVLKTRQSHETVRWIKQYSEKSDVVMSVCNGALILAETGLLDGLTATTYHNAITELEKTFTKTKVVSDQRFVDNGKFITTAGLSSGIDGALHIVEKLKGKSTAQTVALNMEYDWRPDSNYARASLADMYLNRIFEGDDVAHPAISSVKLLNTAGDKNQWVIEFELTGTTTAEEIKDIMEKMIVQKVGWKKEKEVASAKSTWSFISPEKENWNGVLEVKPISSSTDRFISILQINKAKI